MRVLSLALLLLLSSCGGAVALKGNEATPVCSSEPECRAMWNGARSWLERNMAFGLWQDTDTRLTTHRASDDPNLWAIVEKVDIGNGRYRIVADFNCGVVGMCNPNAYDALRAFNQAVNKAYVSFND